MKAKSPRKARSLTALYPSEHVEQREFVEWFRSQYPDLWIFAIPNGGKRGIREAARLKAEGVTAGVPDLYCPAVKLWIEMKRQKGSRTSKEQKDWIVYLAGIGHTAIIAYGYADAVEKTLQLGIDR